jgi:O-acetyl-ADP-ribose deacetylase (regulator of RNase III)
MKKSISESIEVVQTDITRLEMDAIVNAANSRLLGGGGVDGAIHRAAGPQLLEACRAIGGCPTGEARITPGYNLPSRYVIHTVGPVYRGRPQDANLLRSCYQNSLCLVADNSLHTVAFPAISCGAYGYPIKDAAQIAVSTVAEFVAENPEVRVTFTLFAKEDAIIYQNVVKII